MPLTGIPEYLDIRVTAVGPGTMTAELEVRPDLLNPFGSAHGGVLAALMDHVLGAVLYPLIPRGAWAATTELKLNFLARNPRRSPASPLRSHLAHQADRRRSYRRHQRRPPRRCRPRDGHHQRIEAQPALNSVDSWLQTQRMMTSMSVTHLNAITVPESVGEELARCSPSAPARGPRSRSSWVVGEGADGPLWRSSVRCGPTMSKRPWCAPLSTLPPHRS